MWGFFLFVLILMRIVSEYTILWNENDHQGLYLI